MRVFGTTRKARLISATTLAALVIAVIAFIAIAPSDDGEIPRDRYTLANERICLEAKQQIVAASKVSGPAYARLLVPVVVRWREQVAELKTPADRVEKTQALDDALREVEIELATLARVGEEGDRALALASAKRADNATAEVEQAVAELGLSECATETIGFQARSR